MDAEAMVLTLPVPEDGKVRFRFRLKDEVMMTFIRVSIGLPAPPMLLPLVHGLFCFLFLSRQSFTLVRRP